MLHAFLISVVAVAVGEIGDKTQLLALMLAMRFRGRRNSWLIASGILGATLANHALAALAGTWIAESLDPVWLRWGVGLSFIGIGLWTLRPDTLDEDARLRGGGSIFIVTLIAFFLAEMGDKTQIATMALAARFDDLVVVVAGTTLGMLIADLPVVFLGGRLSPGSRLKGIRVIAAVLFGVIGVVTLIGFGR